MLRSSDTRVPGYPTAPFPQTRTCSSLPRMGQVIPEKPLRVVVWSTGTIGRHAIAGVDAHPDLELVGVWTSTDAKEGRDAGELAGLGRELGIKATTDRDALIALAPDAIVHTAMADDRVFECIDDLIVVRRGRHQRHQQRAGAAAVAGGDPAAGDDREDRGRLRQGQRLHAHQRHRPGVRQRRAAAGDDQPQPAHRRGPGHGDLRLLDLLPARRHERHLRLRQADGRGRDDLPSRDPHHGLGQRGPPDRGRPRHHPRRAAHRGGRPPRGRVGHRQRERRRQGQGDDGRGEVRRRRQGRRRPAGGARAHHPHRPRRRSPSGRSRRRARTAATGSRSPASR